MSTGLESNLLYKSFLGSPGYTGHLSTFLDLYIFGLSYFIRGSPRGGSELNWISWLAKLSGTRCWDNFFCKDTED